MHGQQNVKHKYTVWTQGKVLSAKAGCMFSNHQALKGQPTSTVMFQNEKIEVIIHSKLL